MAGARDRSNGNGKLDKLDQAMTSLVQAQAQLVQVQAAAQAQNAQSIAAIARTNAEIAETRRLQAQNERETRETVARIFAILEDHTRTLAEHGRILEAIPGMFAALPEAVRERFGFRPPDPA